MGGDKTITKGPEAQNTFVKFFFRKIKEV